MHRLGERAEHIEEIAEIFHMENLIVEGVFTHLCADESTAAKDRLFTESQGKVFYHAISALEEREMCIRDRPFCVNLCAMPPRGVGTYPYVLTWTDGEKRMQRE